MLRFAKSALLLLPALLLYNCGRCKRHKVDYSRHPLGYYYRLIDFSSDTFHYQPRAIMQLAAGFYTQRDSLFWDSYNDLGDNFFITVDSTASDNFLKHYVSHCAVGDSACLLLRSSDFFMQQFKTRQLPFFSKNDSVVKVRFKIKQVLSAGNFKIAHHNLEAKEQEQIRKYYRSDEEFNNARDPHGFYWVQRPVNAGGHKPKPGNVIALSYKGYYLNGRFLEASPEKFELVYGLPDQLLEGLNYVIGTIKIGQNVKIILPSRLAFGENGSTNGIIPPYTPLLYEIKITDIKP